MRYVTSFERFAKEEGREEGREAGREEGREEGLQQGALRTLTRLLLHRFQELPEELPLRLQKLSLEQIEKLVDAALIVQTLTEFCALIPVPDDTPQSDSPS